MKTMDNKIEKLKKIKYLVLDVDGTLTDSGVIYDENGNELKRFSTKDGQGFNIAHAAGMKIMVMTGRECKATIRRMQELKTDFIFQNVKDKEQFLKQFMTDNGIAREEVAYIGDDLNDYKAMKLCGFVGCPTESAPEVKQIANYITRVKAGYGAMRDVVEFIISERGDRDEVIVKVIRDNM